MSNIEQSLKIIKQVIDLGIKNGGLYNSSDEVVLVSNAFNNIKTHINSLQMNVEAAKEAKTESLVKTTKTK